MLANELAKTPTVVLRLLCDMRGVCDTALGWSKSLDLTCQRVQAGVYSVSAESRGEIALVVYQYVRATSARIREARAVEIHCCGKPAVLSNVRVLPMVPPSAKDEVRPYASVSAWAGRVENKEQ